MLRRLFFCGLLALTLLAPTMWVAPVGAADPVVQVPAVGDPIDRDVELFNPNIYTIDAATQKPKYPSKGAFDFPASDIAHEVVWITWFSSLVFLPFLVLPLLLLVYVIFKFRDQGDGREPATFTGHHTLEIVWTLIPCVALLIVSVPTWFVLERMEAPPIDKKDRMSVRVTGKQFAWDYSYLGIYKNPKAEEKQAIGVGQFLGIQESLVLVNGRTVELHMTSDDVNHAWWIPAFGVKKDCIKGRDTYAWFTPNTTGVYKGQCAELCGDGHGIMIITASVVERPDFERFVALQRVKDDTLKVWSAIQPPAGTAIDEKALRDAVVGFLEKGRSAERQYALRFWIASNYSTLQRVQPIKGVTIGEVFGAVKGANEQQIQTAISARRQKVDALLKELSATSASVPMNHSLNEPLASVEITAGAQP